MDVSLLKLFERSEAEFRRELGSIMLPRDMEKFRMLMDSVFVSHAPIEEYRNELSMQELSMLNSVLTLVKSQVSLLAHTADAADALSPSPACGTCPDIRETDFLPLGATAGGGALGGLLLRGTWGSVLVAIAGCALGMYISWRKGQRKREREPRDYHIDADRYVSTLKSICGSIDEIMSNHISAIRRLRDDYESRPKPTLATAYGSVLQRLAILHATRQGRDAEAVLKDIDGLFRTLRNYRYDFAPYSEATSQYYDVTESPLVREPEATKSAILADGSLLSKGDCLIPENK